MHMLDVILNELLYPLEHAKRMTVGERALAEGNDFNSGYGMPSIHVSAEERRGLLLFRCLRTPSDIFTVCHSSTD